MFGREHPDREGQRPRTRLPRGRIGAAQTRELVKGESEVTEREGSSLSLAGRGRADSSLLPFLRQTTSAKS